MRPRSIRRGDIFLLKPAFAKRGRAAEGRFVAVVQSDLANAFSPSAIVAMVRRDVRRGLPVHVGIAKGGTLPRGAVVDCAMLATLASRFLEKRVARLSPSSLAKVDQALKIALSL